jgi:cyclic pyranopterin phosphate synthase
VPQAADTIARVTRKDTTRRRLSHVGARGEARMVDVSAKPETPRRAVAEGRVRISAEAARLVRANAIAKGDVLATARLAGIAGAKRVPDLVPLCHPLRLDGIDVDVVLARGNDVSIRATVSARERTGVEMEALTAVAVAALTVYDMVKAVDRGATIGSVRLLEKFGGVRGPWARRGVARAGRGPGRRSERP